MPAISPGSDLPQPPSKNIRPLPRLYLYGGLVILVLGLLLRVAAAVFWQSTVVGDSHFRFGDSQTYWVLARTIGDGTPYEYGSPDSKVFRAPLYPLFLSPWTWLLPRGQGEGWYAIMAARWAGCVLGAVCILLVMRQARQLLVNDKKELGGLAGIAAGALAMLYPGAIGMSVFVLSEAIFCPLILLSLGATSRAIASRSLLPSCGYDLRWMMVAGAASGAACLARPSWSLWPGFLLLYLLWISIRHRSSRASESASMAETLEARSSSVSSQALDWARAGACFVLAMCLVMSPWWLRNYQVTGKFVPTTLQVGASLYDGWHAGATGSSDEGMNFVLPLIYEQRAEDEAFAKASKPLEATFEWRLDQRLRKAALEWAWKNSSDAWRLGLVKLGKTWSPLPVARELGNPSVKWAEGIGYSVIMSLAAIGFWQSRYRVGAWLYALPCGYFALLHMFFIGSVRYRQPAVLVICVLGGVGCATLLHWMVAKLAKHGTEFDGSIAAEHVTADKRPS